MRTVIKKEDLGAMIMVLGLGATEVSVVDDKVFVTYVCRGDDRWMRDRISLAKEVDLTFTQELTGYERDAVLRRVSS